MKKNPLFIFYILLTFFIFYIIGEFSLYKFRQNKNKSMIEFCKQNNTNDCYTRMFELIIPKILINKASIDKKEIDLTAFDPLTVRIDSSVAFDNSDLLFGYGVYHNTAYEEAYSEIYDKYSYAFDCGVHSFSPKHPKCLFFSECIASDDFLIFDHMFTKEMQISSGKIHSLKQKLNELNLSNKKIFIKMDVDEADATVIPEFIKNSKNITGLNIALHIKDPAAIIERLPILDALNKDFVLIARHTIRYPYNIKSRIIDSKYYKHVINTRLIYLSYINKSLLDDYSISFNQNTEKYYKEKGLYTKDPKLEYIPLSDVHYIVTLTEKAKEVFNKIINKKVTKPFFIKRESQLN